MLQTLDTTPQTSAETATTAAGGGNCVITYAGIQNQRQVIRGGIAWSYAGGGGFAGGTLTIADGTTTIFQIDITAAGPGFIPLPQITGTPGLKMVVTLTDAGSGNGANKLNILGHYVR